MSSYGDLMFGTIHEVLNVGQIEEGRWATMKKKAVSIIRLAIAPEIKYHYLKETNPAELLELLQTKYAFKSLANNLCLRWELYVMY